ncbi:MAG TPA: class I SAM-dependent methyltransferase [Steroidobacteraceae bacterium]|nr:class I SAM-dependent methyltransferase [Steroidobacteraceae bacterium]
MRAAARPECHLCGSPGVPLYRDLSDSMFSAAGSWSISRCSNRGCGLLWLDPMPLAEDLAMAYASYYTHGAPARTVGYRLGRSLYRAALDIALWVTGIPSERRRSEAMFLGSSPPGALLDVGCGYGAFMSRMKARGWRVRGIDFDPQAARAARDLHGLEVQVGTLEGLTGTDSQFDVITANNVIEHVADPVDFLVRCRGLLRPGGRVILKTPNASGYGARRYGPAWRGLEPPRHLHIFTPPALSACARRAGLSVSSCFTSFGASEEILVASDFIARKGSFREQDLTLREKIASRLQRPLLALKARVAWHRDTLSGEELCAILTADARDPG